MFKKLWELVFPKRSLNELNLKLTREEIIRRSRILFIDDERPALIDDLIASRFAVDYLSDVNPSDLSWIERPIHDLILLDFGDVGKAFGDEQGLSILRHIKRINPSIIVLAYTSKSLKSNQADFYRQADGVLSKDAGIQESTEKIEDGLRQAHSLRNVWKGILDLAGIASDSEEDRRLQDMYVRGLSKKKKLDYFKVAVMAVMPTENAVQAIGGALVSKLIELGMKATGS